MTHPTRTLPPRAAAGARGWTDERIEKLKVLAAQGLSMSQIAKQLGGGLSRNAVTGKLHRLGLNGLSQASTPGSRKPKVAAPKAERPIRSEAQERADGLRAPPVKRATKGGKVSFNFRDAGSAPRPTTNADGEPIQAGEPWVPLSRYDRAFQPLAGTEPRPFFERQVGQCRWPIDGADGEFLACCASSGVKNYCETHHALGHTASVRKPSGEDLIRAFRRVA